MTAYLVPLAIAIIGIAAMIALARVAIRTTDETF